jgi:hypothetical protein
MAFNYQVEYRNKQGEIVRRDPYRMVIDQEKGKRMERPPGSGLWYAEDGSLIKDDSAAIKAAQAQAKAKAQALSEQEAQEAREKLKAELRAELRAELLAEQKAANGTRR